MNVAVLVLCASMIGCVYAYAGYPLLLLVMTRLRPRPVRSGGTEPTVSVIIAAYDEEAVIEAKVRNTLALEYPADRLEVIVASDGSTDATEAIVRRIADPRVRLLALPRRGKLAALNAAVRRARGRILVFTDANIVVAPNALPRLVRPFADPEVGGVCGEKRVRPAAPHGDATAEGEGAYWSYESWLKRLESRIGSVYAADGSLYAIRRRLYVAPENLAQADDIAISARTVLQGYRLVYEPDARCWEDAAPDGRAELSRKVRVANHTLRAVLDLRPGILSAGLYGVQLFSHKPGRYLVPFFLVTAFASNIVLAPASAGFAALLAGQATFYLLALAGTALRFTTIGRLPVLSVPYYFCLVNLAALLAVTEVLRGTARVAWAPRGGAA